MSVDVVGLRALAEKALSEKSFRVGRRTSYGSEEHSAVYLDDAKRTLDPLLDEITTLRAENERLTEQFTAAQGVIGRQTQVLEDIEAQAAESERYERERDAAEAALADRDARIEAALEALHDRDEPFPTMRAIDVLFVPAVPVPQDKPKHGMIPGTHEQPGGPECRCGMPWDYWNERCLAMTAPVEPQDNPEATRSALALAIDPNALELDVYPFPFNAADRVLMKFDVRPKNGES